MTTMTTANSTTISRPLHQPTDNPTLSHSLFQRCSSVLSLAADDAHIYSGSQAEDILVWDKATFTLKATLTGHSASVIALQYAPERRWLFSASGDSSVRVWSTATLSPLYRITPQLDTDAGDLFSLAWSPSLNTVYFGCQNTSLQWYSFPPPPPPSSSSSSSSRCPLSSSLLASSLARASTPESTGTSTPRRAHKFFDSYPQYTRRPADLNARNNLQRSSPPSPPESFSPPSCDDCLAPPVTNHTVPLQVSPHDMIWSAHFGYIYCMALSPSIYDGSDDPPPDSNLPPRLVTGSGDSTVKVWTLPAGAPTLEHTFDCTQGAVLALAVRGETVYAGCQDGHVKVWDLDTRTLVRTIIVQENVDILSLSMLGSDLYTCSANGQIQRYSSSFDLSASWNAHSGIVLSSIIACAEAPKPGHASPTKPHVALITGGNDDYIKIWDVEPPKTRSSPASDLDINGTSNNDTLLYALSKFIAIPSVSNSPRNKEDCRQAAIWLRKCLSQLGAEASLLSTGENNNPLVFATFRGSQTQKKPSRILFYGHYDVIEAPPNGWSSDPFQLFPLNGYLYGRGVTDNKGPVMAVACAAAALLRRRALDLDLVMLVEGEEESGSRGFRETVQKHKDQIGNIDAILVSNSTWISEATPCLTYGLRGVIHCQVEISSSAGNDLHSGVDGGATVEPMMDMVKLLGTLTDNVKRVAIPGFYEMVRPLTAEERQLYKVLSGVTQTPASSLSAKWREPSLTIHNVEVSGPMISTVIPATIKARVSLRIVPEQDLDTISRALQDHLEAEFKSFQSPNHLQLTINHTADWWLGKLDDPWFLALEGAVRDEWGVEPLRIREGGSIPSVPYLEKEFACHALHLPMGQSTDQAHLPNERISLNNLQRGQSVLERFFTAVGSGPTATTTTTPQRNG